MDHLLKKALNGYMWALYGAFDCQYQVERFFILFCRVVAGHSCIAGHSCTKLMQSMIAEISFWVLLDHF